MVSRYGHRFSLCLIMGEPQIKSKAVSGVGWSALDTVAKFGISFVVSLVLARLLGPEEYGLIGLLTIFINVSNTIVDSGFSNAMIRKQGIKDIDYCTVFYTNLAFSLFLVLLLFFCATPIAYFFNRPELVSLTRVLSLVIIINALAIVQETQLVKKIDFKTQTKITIIASLLSGGVGIAMAFCGCGVWSLVGQQLSSRFANMLFLWIFNRWMPKLQFSWTSFKEMWGFGWKLLVSSLIDTTWKEIYNVVIGKCYSPQILGQYTRAQQFSSMGSSNITSIVSKVSYPVLSSVQEDKGRLKAGYKRVIRTTMFPSFVVMMGMAAVAKPMILVLIGEKWLPCVPYLQIICFTSMLYPLHALNLNMLKVQGRSDLFLKLEIIKKIIAIGPLLLGIFVNIFWMLGGGFLTGLFAYYLNAYYSGPFLEYSMKEQIQDILPSFFIALAMALIVFPFSLLNISPFIILPIQLLVGVLFVIILSEKIKLQEYSEIKDILLQYVSKINFKKKRL